MWRVYSLHHTTVFTYSHANTPLGQSERAYYLSYFINKSTGVSFHSSACLSLYNNKVNARDLIGQSAMVYCAGKPMEKSRVFWIII